MLRPMQWNVIHTRPRCEKKIAGLCHAHHLPCYLPLRREPRVVQRRTYTVDLPVFPGYLFAAVDAEGRLALLKSNHILRFITPSHEGKFLRQLVQVRRALRIDPGLKTARALKQGHRVRIKGGAFMGMQGVVSSIRAHSRVMLTVDEVLGQAVVVELDGDLLERIL